MAIIGSSEVLGNGLSPSVLWGVIAISLVLLCVGMLVWLMLSSVRGAAQAYRMQVGMSLRGQLSGVLMYLDVQEALKIGWLVALVLGAAMGGLTESWLMALVGGVFGLALPKWILESLNDRRRSLFAVQLPDVLMMMAGGMRAGGSLPTVLRSVARDAPQPAAQEFDLLLREQSLGVSLDQALGGMERRMRGKDLGLFISAVRVGSEQGGSMAETFDRLAMTIRQRQTVEGRIRTLTAQARAQGWIMVCLPLAVGGVLMLLDPGSMSPLFESWLGWGVCAVVVVLEGVGLLLIRKIMAVDV